MGDFNVSLKWRKIFDEKRLESGDGSVKLSLVESVSLLQDLDSAEKPTCSFSSSCLHNFKGKCQYDGSCDAQIRK